MGKSAINPAVVGKHSTDIAALKNDLGIVEDGDTATHTIAQGQYVIWQGALYTADAAIASGTTLAASGGNKNLTAVENGGLNALNSNLSIRVVQVSGTTTTTGAIMIPSSVTGYKYLNALLTTGGQGFVIRRDTSYFTVFNSDGTLKASTAVVFNAYFMK